jgi:coenzyme PQQ precursor peptide PqqA
MNPSQPIDTRDSVETVREEPKDSDKQPQPWTAPDFVEHRVCAEIGAYAFAER